MHMRIVGSVSTISELLAAHTDLEVTDADWLHLLVGDWQLISDLAFADLVLWVPTGDGSFVAVAQCRPSTGATVHYDDIVGSMAPEGSRADLERTYSSGSIFRIREPRWFGSYAVREDTVPVVHDGRTIAVLVRQTNLGSGRTPSRLELNYVEAADDLLGMVAAGDFPSPDGTTGPRRGAPRVGDGLIRLNSEGEVVYASPNALSCFHRLGVMGALVGDTLIEVVTDLVEHKSTVDESMPLVLLGKAAWRTEVESRGVCLSLRAVPLLDAVGSRIGAVLLCRDVSELRRRERELITKDATIREIHHRVKNNLQTVAALLRLQSRRMTVPEARAALDEAMRRVATIALVHDSLSQTLDERVEFDAMVGRVLRLAADVAAADTPVRTICTGKFGHVPAEAATALALVLTELVTNAVEHGLAPVGGGVVEVVVERTTAGMHIVVSDDGRGTSEDGPGGGLGTQIVSTLVANELRGTISWTGRAGGGTEVHIDVPLDD
ncbi:PAS domain-containing sensor histidine kinase [Rarobacter faecitabidus]|uniref:histidine kinase n=1 Tax=Rarobacter faecitabidus TaxID=13243 RepID=A0A542ZU93_RARFA|nr:PAS domain-containing sensor histidine kinase [Rarobacter faecitabidus]TQL63859.1 two-component sensor histidine kinase [Rarobacter faecitabidus]